MGRVEILRSTTTANPLVMVDRGEQYPPVYTVDEANKLRDDALPEMLANENCDGMCWWCQLDDALRELR